MQPISTPLVAMVAATLLAAAGCARGASPTGEGTARAPDPLHREGVRRGAGTTPTPEENAPMERPEGADAPLHPALESAIASAAADVDVIPAGRRETLDRLAAFVRGRRAAGVPADLTFICTHNSRRSHMGQLWAATAAAWLGVDGVRTWSGGTEVTAFNPRAVAALRRAGFVIDRAADGANPRYRATYGPAGPVMEAWSKRYDDPANPADGFAAVMTCAAADASCPFVEGAALRVSLPYEDPKAADGTPEEAARYDARARQIAAEMLYLFSRI